MDYKTLKDCLGPYLNNNSSIIPETRRVMDSLDTEDAFDKRMLLVLGNILKTFETTEYFKIIIKEIFGNDDFFSAKSVHQTTKTQRLKEILERNKHIERNKQFNLSILQTYMENILSKQLLEINIKIEENQRILHNLGNSNQNQKAAEKEKISYTNYLIVENEKTRYTIRYDTAIELLKIKKRAADKFLSEPVIPYSKITGLNSRNVIKKIVGYNIPKNQPLYNVSYKLNNTVDKLFAIITRKANRLNILFVDSIVNVEPVEAQDMGNFAKTFEGNFKTLEV
ncbi:MAG: hypothetical protein GY699_14580 [Desulfobacteraceae bacterium]|nr:hypothetical protein [Desulfobacteraceae bacterium]